MASKPNLSLVDLPYLSSPAFLSLSPDEEEDQEVTLQVKIIKNVTLRVKASEKIENIKELIRQKEEPILAGFQELVVFGEQFKDGNKLSDYIQAGTSTVHFVYREHQINIVVKRVANDRIISTGLQVKANDTIKVVKSMIDIIEGTKSDEYRLVFDGEQLKDDKTVEASDMKNGSVIQMVQCPRDTMPLRIAMPCGRIEGFVVKRLFTIFDLKAVVQKNIDIPIDRWQLATSYEVLDDPKTIAYYGLEADSLLQVILPSVQIFVRTWSGKHIVISINLTDDVAALKQQIFDKISCPVECQFLKYSRRVLQEGQRIITYGITEGSTVHLSPRSRASAPAQDSDN